MVAGMLAMFFIENLLPGGDQLFFMCVIITVVVSITLHELAHGWAAIWQGDDTPREMGHMTADPLVHMGGASLVALVLVGIAWGMMPVNPNRFRDRRGDALVAAAGPAMNILLALISLTILAIWLRTSGQVETGPGHNVQQLLYIFGVWNIVLALFNMVPVPPLDGSTVLGSFVPAYRRAIDRLPSPEMLFFMFFFVMMMAPPQYNLFSLGYKAASFYLGIFA
ncbi:MAG: site-2 protease family protein [Verrucomicrobiales bacterium]|nr:site-2 protease family protein [Verrucomicrobiales bacterium]